MGFRPFKIGLAFLFLFFFEINTAHGEFFPRKRPLNDSATAGKWIVGGGLGLTFSPTLVLISPQLEYIHSPRLTFGPLFQAGIGNTTFVTFSGAGRYQIGDHPKIKPFVEAGLGLAVGSNAYASSIGIHIMAGMGADYLIDETLSVGTTFRLNLAPPMDTFFMSWPLALARFRL